MLQAGVAQGCIFQKKISLSENCSLLGTDNVRGQISEHTFAPNDGYCLFIVLVLVPLMYQTVIRTTHFEHILMTIVIHVIMHLTLEMNWYIFSRN